MMRHHWRSVCRSGFISGFMGKAVEVVLDGRLGNQMFQYALGRSLSLRLGLPLVLHTSELSLGLPDPFDLPCFRLSNHQVRNWPVSLFHARTRWLSRFASWGIGATHVVQEASLQFSPDVLSVDGPCLLAGYWQSERYFDSISEQLREDFKFRIAGDADSAEYESRIRSVKSVGVHFRRREYVGHPFHGTCSEEYYRAALDLVVSRLGHDVEVFVFSDDIDWCRHNVRYPLPTTYVDRERMERPYEDLRLMSSCRALIMANSSFSWWAGWLNPGPDKLVVAPKRWFQAPGAVSDLPLSPWLVAI
jgi:Glycosyl transferase family 11